MLAEPTQLQSEASRVSIQPEDALIFEANETLELAEEQVQCFL